MSAVSVSGTASVGQVADRRGRRRPRRASRPSARSIRTVSTAYSGMPSARATMASIGRLGQSRHEAGQELAHRRLGQRLEVERVEAALAGAPVGSPLEQLRPGEGDDVDRDAPAPLEEVVDEVEQAGVGEVEVLEDHDHGRGRGEALEERPPGPEQLLASRRLRLDAEQRQQRGLDPAPLLRVGDVGRERLGDLGPGRRLVVGLEQAAAPPDHLAERPEGDPVAVGRAAAVVPPDGLDEAVDVLEELPGEAGLADARRAR